MPPLTDDELPVLAGLARLVVLGVIAAADSTTRMEEPLLAWLSEAWRADATPSKT